MSLLLSIALSLGLLIWATAHTLRVISNIVTPGMQSSPSVRDSLRGGCLVAARYCLALAPVSLVVLVQTGLSLLGAASAFAGLSLVVTASCVLGFACMGWVARTRSRRQ